jgi:hypothetical protein
VKAVAAGLVLVGVTVVGACSDDAGEPDRRATPTTDRGRVSVEPEVSTSSVLDVLEADLASSLEGSRRDLARLIVTPDAVGDDMRLYALEVVDPNGAGRIDGGWSTPRVVMAEGCPVRVDGPPIPSVSAGFLEQDPREPLGEVGSGDGRQAVLPGLNGVGIEVLVFDERSQRDDFAEAIADLYAALGDLDCFGAALGGSGLTGTYLVGTAEEAPPYETGMPAFAANVEGLLGDSLVTQ